MNDGMKLSIKIQQKALALEIVRGFLGSQVASEILILIEDGKICPKEIIKSYYGSFDYKE